MNEVIKMITVRPLRGYVLNRNFRPSGEVVDLPAGQTVKRMPNGTFCVDKYQVASLSPAHLNVETINFEVSHLTSNGDMEEYQ